MTLEGITLGQVGLAITFLVGLATGLGYLRKSLKEWITQSMKEQIDPLRDEVKGLYKRLDDVDMESCKNFLVRFLSDVEQGANIDEVERMRFFEQYAHYSKLGGNSYIRDKVDKLRAAEKL